MSVPDMFAVVDALYRTGQFDLRTHEGQGALVDACVSAFHAKDPKWGHLKKRRGQTAVHGHGEDAALYKHGDGTATAVDFIAGAGGPDPRPRWGVDAFPYTDADWLDPTVHAASEPAPAPSPSFVLPPGRDEALDELNWLDAYYSAPDGLMRPNGLSLHNRPDFLGVSAWYLDVYQRERMKGRSRAEARAVVIANIRGSHEWKEKHPGETP